MKLPWQRRKLTVVPQAPPHPPRVRAPLPLPLRQTTPLAHTSIEVVAPATVPTTVPGRVFTLRAPVHTGIVMESCDIAGPAPVPGRVHTMAPWSSQAPPVISMPLPAPPPPRVVKAKAKAKAPAKAPEPPEPGTRAWKIQNFIASHFQK